MFFKRREAFLPVPAASKHYKNMLQPDYLHYCTQTAAKQKGAPDPAEKEIPVQGADDER